jgi:hypothetical protein
VEQLLTQWARARRHAADEPKHTNRLAFAADLNLPEVGKRVPCGAGSALTTEFDNGRA